MGDSVPPEFVLTHNQNIPHSITMNRTTKLSTAISNLLVSFTHRHEGSLEKKNLKFGCSPEALQLTFPIFTRGQFPNGQRGHTKETEY